MSTPLDPSQPSMFKRALRALHDKDDKAYAAVFLPEGRHSVREKHEGLRKMLDYISQLKAQGYVVVERKNGDAFVTLTDKGLTEIGLKPKGGDNAA